MPKFTSFATVNAPKTATFIQFDIIMKKLTQDYWNQRYLDANTGWDMGQVSPPLKLFMDTLTDKSIRILIPGAGRAYEAIYLHQLGFQNVMVCDWAPEAFDYLKKQAPDFPKAHLLVSDFFQLNVEVDLILEQTFFCAIDPSTRPKYVHKAHELLAPKGILAGLFFDIHFPFEGPPFGGTKDEYINLFHNKFNILEMNTSPYSIQPRLGNELFFQMQKILNS